MNRALTPHGEALLRDQLANRGFRIHHVSDQTVRGLLALLDAAREELHRVRVENAVFRVRAGSHNQSGKVLPFPNREPAA